MASKHRSRGLLIDLTPDEAGLLSFVGSYASIPSAKPQLEHVLSTSTERAKEIGEVILDENRETTPAYKFMAKRFRDAGRSNARNAEILTRLPGY